MKRLLRCYGFFLLSLTLGCGGALTQVSYEPEGVHARDVFLVQVLDRKPSRPTRVVSYAVLPVDTEDEMGRFPQGAQLEKMRAMAASRGAHFLLVEKVDLPWRRAFFGTGLAIVSGSEQAISPCKGPAIAGQKAEAMRAVRECLDGLRQTRGMVRGKLAFSVVVDAVGRAKRALPSSGTTQDTQVQACMLGPIFETTFETQPGRYLCSLTFELDVK